MAEKQLEIAQRAVRRASDYDSMSDSDDGGRMTTTSPSTTSSIRQRGRPTSQPQVVTVSSSFDTVQSSSIDPYAPNNNQSIRAPSLFDDSSFDNGSTHSINSQPQNSASTIPGGAGYLEMEEAPSPIMTADEPIKTDSGLLLTHRKSPTNKKPRPHQSATNEGFFRNAQSDYFEVEHGYSRRGPASRGNRNSMIMVQAKRLFSFVQIWVVISAVLLIGATGVLFHSFGHSEPTEDNTTISSYQQQQQQQAMVDYSQQQILTYNNGMGEPEKVILVPIENLEEPQQLEDPQRQLGFHRDQSTQNVHHHDQHNARRHLMELRDEFESWLLHHGKSYHSHEEKERRFHIWSDNHHKTLEKNRRHGRCKLTKQQVFGSNHLKDLTHEEFKSMYLTGYTGPKADEREKLPPKVRKLSKDSGKVMDPKGTVNMHESVREKVNAHRVAQGQRTLFQEKQPLTATTSRPNCKWYDISCLLRWVWQAAGVQFGSIIGTMEPMYDADAYPNAVDWRESGAVTEVRSQGDCGACWAITAVETIESAHYISTGNLYDLAEAEIITCDDSCEMCSGGWPQNAFEWTMDHGGLPLYNNFPYDGSSLLAMTEGIEGTSNSWTEDTVKAYREEVCPADDDASSGSQDSNEMNDEGEENKNYGDYSSQGRYGNIKGYGYATERCICYSDGSGCDCDEQNEGMAVANVASHGPAVVCLEASLWQDYSGGVITADSGCGSAFLDMNHCVQAVGYAFTDGSEVDEEEDGEGGSGSGSGSGSNDESERTGYWIIRNQWGNYWGMNGYAWVAMGDNTCGVLNDMTQAYL